MFDTSLFTREKRIVVLGGDTVTSSGRLEIAALVAEKSDWCCRGCCQEGISENVGWRWEEKRGKFTTRLSKYVKDTKGINLPPSLLEKMGKIAKDNLLPNEENVILDFDNTLDWDKGDYGDSGSCYFSYNGQARQVMREFGFFSVRFYDEKGKGIARAWIAPPPDLDGFICFGFYGEDKFKVCMALSELFGMGYWSIDLVNSGFSRGLIYHDGAMYVGPTEIKTFDLGFWKEMCSACREKEATRRRQSKVGYCNECYNARFMECKTCGLDTERHESGYCEKHRPIICSLCGKKRSYSGYGNICLDCHYNLCSLCGESPGVSVTSEGYRLCQGCAEKHATPCELCGQLSLKGRKRKTVDGMACCKCYGKYKYDKCKVCGKRHKIMEEDCE